MEGVTSAGLDVAVRRAFVDVIAAAFKATQKFQIYPMSKAPQTSSTPIASGALTRRDFPNDAGFQPHVRQLYSFGLSAIATKNHMMTHSPRVKQLSNK
jgi:hypothetical protein